MNFGSGYEADDDTRTRPVPKSAKTQGPKAPPQVIKGFLWTSLACVITAIICWAAIPLTGDAAELTVLLWLVAAVLVMLSVPLLWLSGHWLARTCIGVTLALLYAALVAILVYSLVKTMPEMTTNMISKTASKASSMDLPTTIVMTVRTAVTFAPILVVGILMMRHGLKVRRSLRLGMAPRTPDVPEPRPRLAIASAVCLTISVILTVLSMVLFATQDSLTTQSAIAIRSMSMALMLLVCPALMLASTILACTSRMWGMRVALAVALLVTGVAGMLLSGMYLANMTVIPHMRGYANSSEVSVIGGLAAIIIFIPIAGLSTCIAICGEIALWSGVLLRRARLKSGTEANENRA